MLKRLLCLLVVSMIPAPALAEARLQLSPELSSPPEAPAIPGLVVRPAIQAPEIVDEIQRIPKVDLITPPDDLLQRLRNGFSMPDLHTPLVADRQAWYLNNPNYIRRVLDRSRKYLYHVVNELEARGMPTELALLPIVESSYNPLAYSKARALGMWQFIPSTGKNFQLKQNWWMDERRDIIASTNAALDYLQSIYEMHGDWHLALASYNWGEGAVGRAIAKNRAKGLPTDYASLTMPAETRYYVPKLQAIKNIIAQPELFGIRLDHIPNRPYFGTVDKPGDMDVTLAAKLAEIPVDEFIALNPAYQRPVIPGDSKSPLVLPADKVQTFLDNLEEHESKDRPLSAWATYVLRPGDKLDKIADKYGISLSRLKQLNGIGARTKLGPGFTLLIPGKDAPRDGQLAALDAKLPDQPAEPTKAAKPTKGGKGAKNGKVASGTVSKSTTGKPVTKVASKAKAPAKSGSKSGKPSGKNLPAKSGSTTKKKK